jgi:hypothetical protein
MFLPRRPTGCAALRGGAVARPVPFAKWTGRIARQSG